MEDPDGGRFCWPATSARAPKGVPGELGDLLALGGRIAGC